MSPERSEPREGPPEGWTWRPERASDDPPDEPGAQLLYEPGNWGDVLKGAWVTAVLEALLDRSAGSLFRYLDPFSGAPTYPLAPAAARRARGIAVEPLCSRLEPHLKEGRWPSTARMVLDGLARRGVLWESWIFDADPSRRAAWRREGEDAAPPVDSGEALVDRALATRERFDLAVIDPYDLFDHWGTWLRRLVPLARRGPVLLYLYDKSARGAGHADQYRRFRERWLREITAPLSWLLGRSAADPVAPRAHHEVLLLGERTALELWRPGLEQLSLGLSRQQASDTPFVPFETGLEH